ncbi:MAG: hypothetical protein Kow00109_22420 [Acidobacteriota bacterium]
MVEVGSISLAARIQRADVAGAPSNFDETSAPSRVHTSRNQEQGSIQRAREETSEKGDRGTEAAPRASARLAQDKDSGKTIVQILDRRTGNVLYEIPPEEVRKLARLLQNLTGSVVDRTA